MKKNKVVISILIILLYYIFSVCNSYKETSEKLNVAIIRIRKKWKFPFGKFRTYIITDINTYNGEKVTHYFIYSINKAVQFINGKFSNILDLNEVY